jgi:hypothetical protein
MRYLTHSLALAAALAVAACASSTSQATTGSVTPASSSASDNRSPGEPMPDPRVGLKAGLHDAAEAAWNVRLVSTTPTAEAMKASMNSDLAFLGNYAIQGSFNGWEVWDISNPTNVRLRTAYFCPESQSDVSAYKNLLIVSGEDLSARLDCAPGGVKDTVSKDRLRGVRIFDISDIDHPRNVGNVQTCRGSHTHSLLVPNNDPDNVYVYISGSSGVRSPNELAGCSSANPEQDPNSALFRIEVIKIPLAHPEQAAIVSSPRIFNNLAAPASHGETKQDSITRTNAVAAAKARGEYTAVIFETERPLPPSFSKMLLDSIVVARGGSGQPTAADSATLRTNIQGIIDKMIGAGGPRHGPTQCHDITLYPAINRAGGACEGYGFLLDITDPAHPVRIDQVADSNFSY